MYESGAVDGEGRLRMALFGVLGTPGPLGPWGAWRGARPRRRPTLDYEEEGEDGGVGTLGADTERRRTGYGPDTGQTRGRREIATKTERKLKNGPARAGRCAARWQRPGFTELSLGRGK